MKLTELNKKQIIQLKQQYLLISKDDISWNDIENADSIVSMEELTNIYGTYDFTVDDFGYYDERGTYSY